MWNSIQSWYRGLPDKKRYLELVTALLTIPVLITVILNNVTSLRGKQEAIPTASNGASSVPITVILSPPPSVGETKPTESASPQQCTPEVGTAEIAYPRQGDTVTADPICIDIVRQSGNYCGVVWSYRLNGGSWSDFTDKEPCLYGVTSGMKELEVRIKSIVSSDETLLRRTFEVVGTSPTPSPPESTSSAQQT